jgi:hypothetical protein
MLARVVVGSWVVIACSISAASPAPDAGKPSRLPVIPDSMTSQLGAVRLAIAVDLAAWKLQRFTAKLPPELACLNDVVPSLGSVVVTSGDSWQAMVTGVPEAATRACLAKVAPVLGFAISDRPGDGYELQIPNNPVKLAWEDKTLVVTQSGHPRTTGVPPAEIMTLLGRVPRAAKFWVVSSGFSAFKLKSAIGWLEAHEDRGVFTFTAEGTEADPSGPWIAGMVAGMKDQAAKRGLKVEDSWIVVTSTKTTTKLTATIPRASVAAFGL